MSDKNKKVKKNIKEEEWTDECEELLAEWSEKASCYRWLHGRCEKNYKKWYYCFSIPVIILSTLTGAANVGMDSFVSQENKSVASAIVGSVNIFAGIISTLQNFLKVAELMEGHRIAGVSWGKLQRNISIELALDPKRRVIQTDFLKLCRAEYDRLIEAGPLIDDGVIYQFNKKFKNYEVSKPSICNGLDKCNIYKIDKNLKMDPIEFTEGIEDIIDDDKLLSNNLQVKIDKIYRDSLNREDESAEQSKLDKPDLPDESDGEIDILNKTNKGISNDKKYADDSDKNINESLNKEIQVDLNIVKKADNEEKDKPDEEKINEEISIFLDGIENNK